MPGNPFHLYGTWGCRVPEDEFLKKHIPLTIVRNAFRSALKVLNSFNKEIWNKIYQFGNLPLGNLPPSSRKALEILRKHEVDWNDVGKKDSPIPDQIYNGEALLSSEYFAKWSSEKNIQIHVNSSTYEKLKDAGGILWSPEQMKILEREIFRKQGESRGGIFERVCSRVQFDRVVEFCGFLLPKKYREEALGDIYETRHDMELKAWPKVSIFCVTFCEIVWLLVSGFRIRLSDFLDSEKERNK
jgi:hypothetical protein